MSHQWQEGYDAVVVGSGYGGSVAACRLSMAGLKVCLIEKGRRWEAHEFPTDSLKMISAVRFEHSNLNLSIGPKDALFQVHIQGDSLAATACGLGGGSLVNAGVMRATPFRARKNPKWPLEWERNWDICQASASDMLRTQSVPVEFSSSRILKQVVEEDIEDVSTSLKLSVNFAKDSLLSASKETDKPGQYGDCIACGNCLSGCPYNAKKSTDKNYIQSAIQAGCIVKTECQVQSVVWNSENISKEVSDSRKRNRRWLVFLNETEYVMADFVILSAGVFGTTEILFQSRKRGLKLSDILGHGFSCNGNALAYVAGSPAPLNSVGIKKKQLSDVPFEERPGPSITSSYTSAKGFTIQNAVIPIACTFMVFKGIATYEWPNGFWFFHGVIEMIKSLLRTKAENIIALCAMGYDDSEGKISFDPETDKLHFTAPHDYLFPKVTEAFQKMAAKLGGILFMSRYRSTSVHLLGGCIASSSYSEGVCNSSGQVFDLVTHNSVHPGLYVCDASLIPCSVGVNPSLTIATVAEQISQKIVEDALCFKSQRTTQNFVSAQNLEAGLVPNKNGTYPVMFRETLKGYIAGMPCTAHLVMKMSFSKQKKLDRNRKVTERSDSLMRGKVGGHIVFQAMEKDKLYIIDGEVDLCHVDDNTPYTQYMYYRLLLAAPSGSRYILEGKKILNPYIFGMYFWSESTTLQVTFVRLSKNDSASPMDPLHGELKISLMGLLKSTASLKGGYRGHFVCQFLHSLYETYVSQIPRSIHSFLQSHPLPSSYPSSILHHIQTDDGLSISCIQWKVKEDLQKPEGSEKLCNPVLLVNGYSAESFWLPTEPNDLVRAVLNEGHEVWLLQPRLHPSHPSNNFTIEDIGRYDIPSAICKIQEIHGLPTKVHIVAHCVGGLVTHMALMGGYVSASSIASLTCTNSSMFFNLTTSARVKMWLPLIPASMAILGKNKILPLSDSLKTSSRHYLLKSIARIIPRYERCTYDQCEIFSGIFGNAFWHSNISPAIHQLLAKETLPLIPMAAFPHLRKICNAGFIVNSNGENSFLIHPERMGLSTLYISGGRTLLVTPETSFLAHKYMKLHQPRFHHNRVVVEGFGHSDLLVGEESHSKVFPHIISHIRLSEQTKGCHEGSKCSNEALSWSYDASSTGRIGSGSCLSPGVTLCLFIIFLVCVIYSSH